MINSGLAVRIVRQAKGLTQTELANNAGISAPFLSLLERGQRDPSLAVLRRLAAALDVPSEALILLSQSPGSSLESSDEGVRKLADSVRKLAEAEEKLRATLGDSN